MTLARRTMLGSAMLPLLVGRGAAAQTRTDPACESAAGFGADQHDKALKRRGPSGSRDRADIQPVFMPVRITGDMPPLGHSVPALPGPGQSPALSAPAPERIEIALPDGTCIRVGSDVGLVALRRVMAAVRR